MNKADCDRLEAHAKEMGATIFWDVESREGAYSCTNTKTLHLMKEGLDAGGSSYVVAMHELGHIATTDSKKVEDAFSSSASLETLMAQVMLGFQTNPPDQVAIEAEAWCWGFKNAGRRLTHEDKAIAAYSVSTYLIGAADMFGAYPIEDPPNEVVKQFALAIGDVDWSHAKILDWQPDARKQQKDFEEAWKIMLAAARGEDRAAAVA